MSIEITLATIIAGSTAATVSVVSAIVSWVKSKQNKENVSLTFEMADGTIFQTKGIPSKTKIEDLVKKFIDSDVFPVLKGSTRRIVVDHRFQNGSSERLNPDKTLNDYSIISGETLMVFSESTAGCFPGNTLITMENGEKKLIEEIKIGDKVLSFNPIQDFETDSNINSMVEKIFKGKAFNILEINNTLKITDSHLLLSNGQWSRAKDMKIGDILHDENGSSIPIRKIELIEGELEIFNLYLSSRNAPFFANGIIVQNMLGGPKNIAKVVSNEAEPIASADLQGSAALHPANR